MTDVERADELVRRLAAAVRGSSLYAADHPLVRRGVDAFTTACTRRLERTDTTVIGFVGDEVVVDGVRLVRSAPSLAGFARGLRESEIEKIILARGLTRDDVEAFLTELRDRQSSLPVGDRLGRRGIRRLAVGRIVVADEPEPSAGIAAARKVYASAVQTAEALWDSARAGDHPDPAAARRIIDSLARTVTQDRTSLMALTALKKYDNYTFTHMVNVCVLAMAQARTLNLDGALLREFGFAALMHDIGKVHTPRDILNKPDRLTKEEFAIMKRHVVDGAHILRRTPEMPALAPVVAFEHHLKQDLSGYPEDVGHRELNLCTMIVSIADVYDALRSHRIYREGLPTDRIRSVMGQQDSTAFHPVLLRRFVKLLGLYPVGTLVRLNTEELAVVTAEHPTDPFRPQVRIVQDAAGHGLDDPPLVNTWERDGRGEYPRAVTDAVDPDSVPVDPLAHL